MLLRPMGGGVVLETEGTRIAVDVPRPVPKATHFVTHAHADHIGAARRVPAKGTVVTAHVATIRRANVEGIRELEPISVGNVSIELIPAGHIPGSAQVVIHDGRSVAVTGDFKLEADVVEREAEIPEADVLVLDTTFFHPDYVFPPRRELYRKLAHFIDETRTEGKHAVVFAYSVGKGQEITAFLNTLGVVPIVSAEMHRVNSLFGLSDVPIGAPGWRELLEEPSVLVLPPRFSRAIREIEISVGRVRHVRASGWNPLLPLSSHADFAQTLEFVERTDPDVVITYGQNAEIGALELRRRGYDAVPLRKPIIV